MAPDRCYRVVGGAAGASASINFSYEFDQSGNVLAGGYVGLLNVLGMVMFQEFLSQFEDGVDNRRLRQAVLPAPYANKPKTSVSNCRTDSLIYLRRPPSIVLSRP